MANIELDHDRMLLQHMHLLDISNSCLVAHSCHASEVDADVQRSAEAASERLSEVQKMVWGIFTRDADNIYFGGKVLERTEQQIAGLEW